VTDEEAASMITETPSPPGKVHEAIAAVMGEVGGVAKGRKNLQQGYAFRGIADITKACQPLMAKHGLHVVPHEVLDEVVAERTTQKGGAIYHARQRIVFRFYHRDGSWVQCVTTGEAMDTGDKTSNKVMSAALKYALTQTFCIPEEDPDVDTETASPEVKPSTPPKAETPPNGKPPSSPSVGRAASGGRAPASSTNGPDNDPLFDLRKTWCGPKPTGLEGNLTTYAQWMRETFGVRQSKEMSPQQIKDAYTLVLAKVKGETEYQTERAALWALGRKYGPEMDDLPPAMGGEPTPKPPADDWEDPNA
jgi:hypothetical protein